MQATRAFWAKLGIGESPSVHPLPCHLLDAGFVAGALWEHCLGRGLRDRLAGAFGCEPVTFGTWVSFIAGLHDLGRSFRQQTSAPDGRRLADRRGHACAGVRWSSIRCPVTCRPLG